MVAINLDGFLVSLVRTLAKIPSCFFSISMCILLAEIVCNFSILSFVVFLSIADFVVASQLLNSFSRSWNLVSNYHSFCHFAGFRSSESATHDWGFSDIFVYYDHLSDSV